MPFEMTRETQSLRSVLSALKEEEILTFETERTDYLLSALVQELEDQERYPVVELFDPKTKQRTIANLFADRERLKRCISNITAIDQASERFQKLEIIDKAPAQEVVLVEDELDALALPVFRHFEGDAGRYISSGIVVAKDPDTGRYNLSFHRMQLKEKNWIGISLHSRGDLWNYFLKSEQQGKDLEIAVIIGCHPAFYITAASKIPPTQDDYSWVGGYLNEPVSVTKCKTVDLLVPAFAEYVLEGRLLAGVREEEGPFGEYTGFCTSRSTNNVFEVSCITHRKDAIYQDLIPGFSWEHLLLSQFTKEIILLDKLRREFPNVTGLNLPKSGCHFHAYVSMKHPRPGQAKQVMLFLFGLDLYLKIIVVVDDDVDVYSESAVLWAMATQMQADRDVFIIPGVICNALDPSSRDCLSAKMGIDATRKAGSESKRTSLPKEVLIKAKELLKK